MVGSRDVVMRNDVWKALDDLCYLYTSKVDTSQPARDPDTQLLAMQLAVLHRPDQQCLQVRGMCSVKRNVKQTWTCFGQSTRLITCSRACMALHFVCL